MTLSRQCLQPCESDCSTHRSSSKLLGCSIDSVQLGLTTSNLPFGTMKQPLIGVLSLCETANCMFLPQWVPAVSQGTAPALLQVPEPEFEGQTKTRLGNPEVRKIVENIVAQVSSCLAQLCAGVWQILCRRCHHFARRGVALVDTGPVQAEMCCAQPCSAV